MWPLIACHFPHWNNPVFISCTITKFCVIAWHLFWLSITERQKYCQTLGYKPNPSIPQCDFQCLILPTIKKYSLLLKLKQNIKQLRMDRNNKKIDLAKRIIACQRTEPFPAKQYSSRTQTPHSKHENCSNSGVWSKPVLNSKYFWMILSLDLILSNFRKNRPTFRWGKKYGKLLNRIIFSSKLKIISALL